MQTKKQHVEIEIKLCLAPPTFGDLRTPKRCSQATYTMEYVAFGHFLMQLKLSSGCDKDINIDMLYQKLSSIPELKEMIDKCPNSVNCANKIYLKVLTNEIVMDIIQAKSQSIAAETQTDTAPPASPTQQLQSEKSTVAPEQPERPEQSDHTLPATVYTPPKAVSQVTLFLLKLSSPDITCFSL